MDLHDECFVCLFVWLWLEEIDDRRTEDEEFVLSSLVFVLVIYFSTIKSISHPICKLK